MRKLTAQHVSDIIKRCKAKEKELLNKYFGNLVEEAANERPEYIGAYTKDLPTKVNAEFCVFLEEIWKTISDEPMVLEERRLRAYITEDDVEGVETAYQAAKEYTLWEKITKSNHKDVTHYKGLLHQYTRELLMVTRLDFLEEITGEHIENKAFDD